MSYQVNKFNGTVLTVLQDGTIDTSTSITLVGRNTTGYGEAQNENFVFLLENFSNDAPPSVPISGQLWFDSANNAVNVYAGTEWVEVGAAQISETQPTSATLGGFWFNPLDKNLYTYNGSEWIFVGPGNLKDFGVTRHVSSQIRGEDGRDYPAILHTIDDTVIAISANSNFTINQTVNPVNGFNSISPGTTLLEQNPIYGNLEGTAKRAVILDKTRTINGVGFNGSKNINIFAPTPQNLIAGEYIRGNTFNGSNELQWDVDATSNNVIGTVVARDSQGNFSANNIIADVQGNLSGNVEATVGTSKFARVEANEFIGQSLSGNAATATRIRFPVDINGVPFDGTADITVSADAKTLTNDTLASNVRFSNLERVGILEALGVADNGLVIGLSGQIRLQNLGTPKLQVQEKFDILIDDRNYLSFISASESLSLGGESTDTVFGDGINLGHALNKFDKVYANEFLGNASTADLSTASDNITGGGAGAIPYQSNINETAFLAPGSPLQYLRLNGAGVPEWDDLDPQGLRAGNFIVGDTYNGQVEKTWNIDATSANIADKIIARDSAGNFSAGTITASLIGNASSATSASQLTGARTINGVVFDNTSNITITAQDPDSVTVSGDTMTGFLTLHADPTTNLHAATKRYVDTTVEEKIDDLGPGQVRAFVRFDGSDLSIKNSLRVSGVDRISRGRYRINFESGTFNNGNYILNGMTSDTDHFVVFKSSNAVSAEIFTVDNASGNNTPSNTGGDVMITFFT